MSIFEGLESYKQFNLLAPVPFFKTSRLQQHIYSLLRQKTWFLSSIAKLAVKFDVSEDQVKKDIQEMYDHGLIGQVGW